jgi:hypothetical protein
MDTVNIDMGVSFTEGVLHVSLDQRQLIRWPIPYIAPHKFSIMEGVRN